MTKDEQRNIISFLDKTIEVYNGYYFLSIDDFRSLTWYDRYNETKLKISKVYEEEQSYAIILAFNYLDNYLHYLKEHHTNRRDDALYKKMELYIDDFNEDIGSITNYTSHQHTYLDSQKLYLLTLIRKNYLDNKELCDYWSDLFLKETRDYYNRFMNIHSENEEEIEKMERELDLHYANNPIEFNKPSTGSHDVDTKIEEVVLRVLKKLTDD